MFRAPMKVRKIAYCSFGSIKHTVLSVKKNGYGMKNGFMISLCTEEIYSVLLKLQYEIFIGALSVVHSPSYL